MRLDAKSGVRGVLINRDTGQRITHVRWAEIPDNPEQSGEYEAFRIDPELAKARGIPLVSILYRGRCRMQFTSATILENKPVIHLAPSTPLDEIRHEVLKGGEVKVTSIIYLPGMPIPECEERLCHRPATWSVATERIVEPERGEDGRLYERAVTVLTRVYCDRHYRPPVQISQRGVESEVEITRARPQ